MNLLVIHFLIIINNGDMTLEKHKSKSHKGFEKMYRRQSEKPQEVKIKFPVSELLPKNFKGKYKHYIKVTNSIWNGINLVCLKNSFNKDCFGRQIEGGIYGKFKISVEGKYQLSRYGQDILRRKKLIK